MLPTHPVNIYTSLPKPKGYPKELNTLSEHIKATRLDRKLSKVDVSKILDVSPLTIGNWENSNKKPVPRMMKKIIEWLGYVPSLGIDKNTLGGQLFIYRMKNGLTQLDVSTALKIDRHIVTKCEQGYEVKNIYVQKIRELTC
nr:helix-turn-helix transcriptional regulator [uncultured Psychroserpens sp.]